MYDVKSKQNCVKPQTITNYRWICLVVIWFHIVKSFDKNKVKLSSFNIHCKMDSLRFTIGGSFKTTAPYLTTIQI